MKTPPTAKKPGERPAPTSGKKPRPAAAPKVTFEDLTGTDEGEGSTRVDPSQEQLKPSWSRWAEKQQAWEPYELLPYQPSIEDLWHRLCMADIHVPMREVMDNLDAFVGCAKKLLYLLSHEPWQYRHLRSDPAAFIEEIERWADIHVPRSRNLELSIMVLRIHNAAHAHDLAAGQ